VLPGTVATWIGNAAAVLRGPWGAVTRWVQPSGASAQAGRISDDALWHANERRKADNAALWQAWSEAEDRSEAKQRAGGFPIVLAKISHMYRMGRVPARCG
jgi:hypothetical protein